MFIWECFTFSIIFEGWFWQMYDFWLTVSFSTLNVSSHSVLVSKVSDKKVADNLIEDPLHDDMLLSCYFPNSLLVFVFWQFDYLWVEFILLGIYWVYQILIFMSFIKIQKFMAIISLNSLFVLLSFWNSHNAYCWSAYPQIT